MYNTNFVNQNSENNIVEAGRKSLAGTLEALQFWQENGTDLDGYEYENFTRRELLEEFDGDREEVRKVEAIIEEFKNGVGDFHEYGLSFDFVEATEEHDAFYRYQMSWGGPSDEFRFYVNGAIEYVYLDWFSGVGFNLNRCDDAQRLKEYFEEIGMIDFDSQEPCVLYRIEECEEDSEEEEY